MKYVDLTAHLPAELREFYGTLRLVFGDDVKPHVQQTNHDGAREYPVITSAAVLAAYRAGVDDGARKGGRS